MSPRPPLIFPKDIFELVDFATLFIAFLAAPIEPLLAALNISLPAADIQLCWGGEEDMCKVWVQVQSEVAI